MGAFIRRLPINDEIADVLEAATPTSYETLAGFPGR